MSRPVACHTSDKDRPDSRGDDFSVCVCVCGVRQRRLRRGAAAAARRGIRRGCGALMRGRCGAAARLCACSSRRALAEVAAVGAGHHRGSLATPFEGCLVRGWRGDPRHPHVGSGDPSRNAPRSCRGCGLSEVPLAAAGPACQGGCLRAAATCWIERPGPAGLRPATVCSRSSLRGGDRRRGYTPPTRPREDGGLETRASVPLLP